MVHSKLRHPLASFASLSARGSSAFCASRRTFASNMSLCSHLGFCSGSSKSLWTCHTSECHHQSNLLMQGAGGLFERSLGTRIEISWKKQLKKMEAAAWHLTTRGTCTSFDPLALPAWTFRASAVASWVSWEKTRRYENNWCLQSISTNIETDSHSLHSTSCNRFNRSTLWAELVSTFE